MIIIGRPVSVTLATPKIIGRYSCSFYLEYPNSAIKIYFTNVTSEEDVKRYNFVSVLASWDQGFVVLAPDALNGDRGSYLIHTNYDVECTLIGVRQRCIFGFFYVGKGAYNEILALGRHFPEIYDQNGTLLEMSFSTTLNERTAILDAICTNGQQYWLERRGIDLSDVRGTDFVMKYKETESRIHPRTRFVIDDNNLIFVPVGTSQDEIANFLNLPNLPTKASIVWTDDLRSTVADFMQAEEANEIIGRTKIIMFGYSTDVMEEVRTALRPYYCKCKR